MTDFTTITACGECCVECAKKKEGICPGCIEADGRVPDMMPWNPDIVRHLSALRDEYAKGGTCKCKT